MHKGCIILVKATDKEDALGQVVNFMEPYGDGDVWDWYQIGGRWTNTLAPKVLVDAFNEKAKEMLPVGEHGFYLQKDVDKLLPDLQKTWEKVGLNGQCPFSNHYDLPNEGGYYDAAPLAECLDTVKEWVKDLEKEKEELFGKLIESREKKDTMDAYYAGLYKDASYGNFCFESNVYNVTEELAEEIPDDVTGYWAVMVDMHH